MAEIFMQNISFDLNQGDIIRVSSALRYGMPPLIFSWNRFRHWPMYSISLHFTFQEVNFLTSKSTYIRTEMVARLIAVVGR